MDNEKLKRDKKLAIRILHINLFILWVLSQEQFVQFTRYLLAQNAKDTLFDFSLALQILSSVLFYIMSVFCTDEYNQIAISFEKTYFKRVVSKIFFFLGDRLYRITVSFWMLIFKIFFAFNNNQEGIKSATDGHNAIIQKYEKYPQNIKILSISFALSFLLFAGAYILELTSRLGLTSPQILQYYSKAIGLAVSFIGFFSVIRSSTTYLLSRSDAAMKNENQ